jgi:hypothetical protein
MLTLIRLLRLTLEKKDAFVVALESRLAGIFSNGEFPKRAISKSFSVPFGGRKQQNKVRKNIA